MRFQLLPSTFGEDGRFSLKQHLACFVIDDCIAIDAGSLAMAVSDQQKNKIRDIILTHAHLDHIAGLPLFVDDLFAHLKTPLCVYAPSEVIEILERDVFNWSVYPRFSELKNDFGPVMQYSPFEIGKQFKVGHLTVKSVGVNHKVPSVGFVLKDEKTTVAITGDTSETEEFWNIVNSEEHLEAVLIECAFPDEMEQLAEISHHLTPRSLKTQIQNLKHENCPIYVINLKPMYREKIICEIEQLKINNLQVLEVGRIYNWSY